MHLHRVPAGAQEIGHDPVPAGSKKTLRMELDSVQRQVPVPNAHDLAVGGPGGDEQIVGQRLAIHAQRVVAGCSEGRGQVSEQFAAVVMDFAGLAVYERSCGNNAAAKGLRDALVTEAHSENRQRIGKVRDDIQAGAGIVRPAGAGRNNDATWVDGTNIFDGDVIIASDCKGRAGLCLANQAHQVVGEGIVIVYYEHHCCRVRLGPELPLDETCVDIAADEPRVLAERGIERDRRFDRADLELFQAAGHAADGLLARWFVNDQLADQ